MNTYPRVTEIVQAKDEGERIKLIKKREAWNKRYDKGLETETWDEYCDRRKSEGTEIHLIAYTYLVFKLGVLLNTYALSLVDFRLALFFSPKFTYTLTSHVQKIPAYWFPLQQQLDQIGGVPVGLEQQIVHEGLKYRGTYDIRLFFPESDRYALLDLKTCEKGTWDTTWQMWKKPKKGEQREWTFEWLSYKPRDAMLQCALYKLASDAADNPIHEIWVLVSAPGGCQLIELRAEWWIDCVGLAVSKVREFHEKKKKAEKVPAEVPF